MWSIAWIVGGVLFAEVYVYWLHRLLHSDKIHWLTRNHMIHHLKIYGPRMKQRPEVAYRYAVAGRAHLGGLGLEWLVPIGVTSTALYGIFALVGAPWTRASLFIGVALLYSYFVLWRLHNTMHQRETWVSELPLVKGWFARARRRHDIHHVRLNDQGFLNANFGIAFAWTDRLFGTFCDRASPVNDAALERAHERYREVMG